MVNDHPISVLLSTVLVDGEAALYRGRPVLEAYAHFRSVVESAAGSEGVRLFAIPEAAFSRTRNATLITWYTDLPGTFQPLSALDEDSRRRAGEQLTARLAALVAGADAELAAMLAPALNVPSADNILFNGADVVLTAWGFHGRGETGSALRPYLPAGFLSVRSGEGQEIDLGDRVAGPATTPPKSEAPARPEAIPAGTVIVADGAGRWDRAVPLAVFAGLLLLVLLYLLWPGHLIYPVAHRSGLDARAVSEAEQATERALTERISRLQNVMRGDVCAAGPDIDRMSGLPVLPGLAAHEPAISPASPSSTAAANTGTVAGDNGSLVERLDRGTVFVIGETAEGVGMGSGFLIDDQHVLTNAHVVEAFKSPPQVANRHMGGVIAARIVARSSDSGIGHQDFALLKLERAVPSSALSFALQAERLDSVVAAGYPSFVMASDPNFIAAFRSGDVSRLAELQLALTRGEITVRQTTAAGTTTLAHSATISQGNSGGPLIDGCGRVVGVNTYTRTDAGASLRLNFALSSRDAVAFLKASGFAPLIQDETCSGATGMAATAPSSAAPSPVAGGTAP